MRKWICLIGGATVVTSIGLTAAPTATAADGPPHACVSGHSDRCFDSLRKAVARAVNGDVVTLTEGTFTGGITIKKSITVVGAGEQETIIQGGGPVLTVVASSQYRPIVDLADLTIRGGTNTGTGLGGKATGYDAFGGGILVPFSNGNRGAGASLTLRRVTVAGNRAIPSTTLPSPSGAQCPEGDCPYAGAFGGGIATAGRLTLVDATVADNLAGGTASDANGGGIFSAIGPVDITRSRIEGNAAAPASNTIGRWAEGGGITVGDSSRPTTITDSHIVGNTARLVTAWPAGVNMAAQSGGVFMEGNTQLTMTGSVLSANRVVAHAPAGEPLVIDAALHYQYGGDGLLLEDTDITNNTLVARVGTTENVAPVGGIVEVDGHAVMRGVTISGNSATLHTSDGTAALSGALFLCGCGNGDGGVTDLTDVTVADNISTASAEHGPAGVWGGGIFAVDGTHLSLRASRVAGNRSVARARDGSGKAEVRGGGLWAGPLWGEDPSVDLTGSIVTGNSGSVSPGGAVLGGGVYAEVPVTGTDGVTGNYPDDLYLP
ncbi:MAG: hypothetical protein ABWX84_14525 [Nocardioides sp.]